MSVAFRIAWRELIGGFKGFWIYLACLALGAAAIASAGSVTQVFTRGLNSEARMLLGGDAMFTAAQRRADPTERAYVTALGQTSETASLNLMGTRGERRQQVDITAVDSAFPLLGTVEISHGETNLSTALALQDDLWGAAVSQSFLDTFEAQIGDTVEIGPIRAQIRARLDGLPDQIGTPGTFGPAALVHIDSLIENNRLEPGQLFRSRLLLKTAQQTDFEALKSGFEDTLSDSSLRVRGPKDAVDGLQNLLTTLNSFLAIIGIASLIAGGVGVSQATTSFLETRIESIAALKALGADSATIRNAYMIQLGALAIIGSLIGVAIGAAAPYLLAAFAGNIPLPQALGIYPAPLFKALVLGVLAAAVFALPAIGRARATRPSALFRSIGEDKRTKTPWFERLLTAAAAISLVAVAVITSARPLMTLALLFGAILGWGVFLLAGQAIKRLARSFARRAKGLWRLTLSNLGGPGSLAPTIVPALGLGLALLTLVASVQANLLHQITETAPANAPSMIFSQIPADGIEIFDQLMADQGVDTRDDEAYRRAPFLLVRVTKLKGEPVNLEAVAEEERWVVRGETSVTYLARQPSEAVLTAGTWWPEDYAGPLLVSVEADAAAGLHITLGDTIGFRVFGREVSATVASLRSVDWGSFGIGSNTAFVFSPGTLEAAKPYHVAIAKTAPEAEQPIIKALGESLPEVVVFQTRPALETAARLFGDIAIAVNAAAGVVTIAGLLVLLGAFAAMARKRRHEAALLKTFGAQRGEVLRLYAGEFAFAGAAGAVIGAGLGIGAAYPIVVYVFEATWTWPIQQAALVIALAIGVSAIGGAIVGWSTLVHPPARVLRST